MESYDLYQYIASNYTAFLEYTRAQQLTIDGKKFLLECIAALCPTLLEATNALLIGADLGTYYHLLGQLNPRIHLEILDRSKYMLEFVQKELSVDPVNLIQSKAENPWPTEKRFEHILAVFFMHLLKSRDGLWRNIAYHLSPSGSYIVGTMTPEQERSHPMATYLDSPKTGSFPRTNILREEASLYGLDCVVERAICYSGRIANQDIPIAFSQYANSYLFNHPPERIADFQNHLKEQGCDGSVALKFDWTVLVFKPKENA
jgi:hypothetical protein